ncbi:hypothetical protein [Streptomyces zaomyceticus]|uniref:hypothetical protein n=1 Tax=Streptomyces zaomyceticus TaxID=68286 RepID=UPI00342A06C9
MATTVRVAIYDGRADSVSVQALYDHRCDTGLRYDNSGGSRSTAYTGRDATEFVRKMTACVNVRLNPDRCGARRPPGRRERATPAVELSGPLHHGT